MQDVLNYSGDNELGRVIQRGMMSNSLKAVVILSLTIWLGGKLLLMAVFGGNMTAQNLLIVTDIAGVLALIFGIVLLVRKLRNS